jgi:hypothetical protein
MLRPLARTLVVTLAAAVAPACTQDNPLFAPIGGDDATTATSSTTTGEPGVTATSVGSGTSEGSSTDPTTSGVEPGTTTTSTTTDPIGTSTTTDPIDTSTGEPIPDTSTGEPAPEAVTVVASLATCVLLGNMQLFLPYIGPSGCEAVTELNDQSDEVGVMVLDQGFIPASGRESRIYLRFEVPDAPEGKVLTSATLTVLVGTGIGAGGTWSGDLYLSDGFDENSLKAFAPGGDLLVANPGPSVAGQWSLWQIPLPSVLPNQPLFLGLGSLDSDGVLFRSSRASEDLKPRLELIYE